MGQKVNPHGLRVGIIKDWDSKWYASDAEFADLLVEDFNIRKYLKKKLYSAGISKIEIERASDRVKVIIYTAKPGVVIGKGGAEIEQTKKELTKLTDKKVLVDIKEIKRPDSREIVFLDNNVLASGHGLEQIDRMGREKVWVDFNQGLDARLITPEVARLLAGLRWIRFIRLSCDTGEMLPVIKQATAYLREAGAAPSRFWAYALVQDVEEAHRRVLALRDMGVEPFAQPYQDYNGGEPTKEQKSFARWVNMKSAFRSCTWEEFRR